MAFWATPEMSVGHLFFAFGCTAYIFIGIFLEENLRVDLVLPTSIAKRMQFQEGDVLIKWDDVKLDSYEDFDGQHEKIKFGDPYRIKIRRNNSVLELKGVL